MKIDWQMEADRANRLYADASRRIEQLEAALREILEPFEEGHQTAFDVAIADRIRAALAPEQEK